MLVNAPMDPEFFLCCICKVEYDQVKRLPKILPACGHTFCLDCLAKMVDDQKQIKCPLDQDLTVLSVQNIESLPTNISLKQIVDHRSKMREDLCYEHDGELKNLVCMTDKCKVCKFCVDYGSHSGHTVKYVKDVLTEADTRRQKLEAQLKECELGIESVSILLGKKKESLCERVKDRFLVLRTALNKQEQDLVHRIGDFFDQRRNKKIQSETYRTTLEVRQRVEDKIEALKELRFDQTFFSAFEDQAEPSIWKLEHDLLERQCQDLKGNLLESLEHYIATTISRIQEAKDIKVEFHLPQRSSIPKIDELKAHISHFANVLKKSQLELIQNEVEEGNLRSLSDHQVKLEFLNPLKFQSVKNSVQKMNPSMSSFIRTDYKNHRTTLFDPNFSYNGLHPTKPRNALTERPFICLSNLTSPIFKREEDDSIQISSESSSRVEVIDNRPLEFILPSGFSVILEENPVNQESHQTSVSAFQIADN